MLVAVTSAGESTRHEVWIRLQWEGGAPRKRINDWERRENNQDIVTPGKWPHHGEQLLRQRVVVREELQMRRRRQAGGRLVVVVVGIAEVPSDGQLLSHYIHLVFDPL